MRHLGGICARQPFVAVIKYQESTKEGRLVWAHGSRCFQRIMDKRQRSVPIATRVARAIGPHCQYEEGRQHLHCSRPQSRKSVLDLWSPHLPCWAIGLSQFHCRDRRLASHLPWKNRHLKVSIHFSCIHSTTNLRRMTQNRENCLSGHLGCQAETPPSVVM